MGLTRPRFNQLQESDFKSSCRVATTSNVTLSGGTPATVDGVNLQVNDRVLVTGQTDATENGIYFVSTLGSGSNGSWTRALDANENAEVSSGLILTVTEGTLHSSSIWKLTTADPITIGGTELTFVPNLENSNVYVKALDISDSLTTIDSFSASGVTTVRWLISATDNVGGYHKTSTVDAVTNGTTITEIEYGVLLSDESQEVVTIGTAISNGNIVLQGTGTSANVSVRVNRITLGSDTTTGYIRAQVLASAASAVDLSAVDQDIIPATDVTYDIGSASYRWRDLYLSGSTIDLGGAKIKTDDTTGSIAFVPPVTESNPNPKALVVSATGETSVATTSGGVLTTGNIQSAAPSAPPKISSVAVTDSSYNELDDTAVALEGGYIIITGAGFVGGCQVLIDGTLASSISVINNTTIHAQIGAKTAGTYTMYVVNPDGATGVRINAVTYSATPTWITDSTLASQLTGTSFSISLSASDATTYALAAGSSLPVGMTLASNGTLSGTITVETETTYNFTVVATDAENQDSPRTFSVTVTVSQPYRADPFASNLRLALPFDQTYQFSDIAYKINGSPNTTSISQLNSNKSAVISSGATKWSSFGYTSSYYEATKVSPACKYTLPVTLDPRTDFTIEGWFYPTGTNNNWTISSADVNGRFLIEVTTGSENYLFSNQAQIKVPGGAWYHVAITNTNIYVNGVSRATGSFTNTGFTTLHVGQFNDTDGNNYLGYMQDLRVYIGVKKYTSNFTPGDNSIIEDYSLITPL